jgi:hypothetical protein
MAVRPKRYISQGGRVVSAVKLTEANYNDAADWANNNSVNLTAGTESIVKLSATGDESNHRVRLRIKGKGIRVARVGDYIAYVVADNGKGRFIPVDKHVFILKGKIFEDKYTEIKKA